MGWMYEERDQPAPSGWGGGGDSHIKVTGDAHHLLRGVNCRFWSHFGSFGMESHYIFPFSYCLGLFKKNLQKMPQH